MLSIHILTSFVILAVGAAPNSNATSSSGLSGNTTVSSSNGASATAAAAAANPTFTFPVSQTPPGSAHLIDPSFVNFAFSFDSFMDYALVNPQNGQYSPNQYSANMINNIYALASSGGPILRVGGTTGDFAQYKADQQEPVQPYESLGPSGSIPAFSTTWNEEYYQYCASFGKLLNPVVSWMAQITLQNRATNYIEGWARNFTAYLGADSLKVIEIGNEPDQYPKGTGYLGLATVQAYVDQFVSQQTIVQNALNIDNPPLYQIGDLSAHVANPTDSSYEYTDIDIAQYNNGQILASGTVQAAAAHFYLTNGKKDLSAILSYDAIKTAMTPQTEWSNWYAANHPKIDFIISELGQNIGFNDETYQSSLASALWRSAYSFYCMANGITRIHHQSLVSSYQSLWLPHQSGSYSAQTFGSYYALPFTAEFIGSGTTTSVTRMATPSGASEDKLAVFAAYSNSKIARLAIVNLNEWSANTSSGGRPATVINFSVLSGVKSVDVKVLTHASGADGLASGISYGSQQYLASNNGAPSAVTPSTTVTGKPVTSGQVAITSLWSTGQLVILNY